MIDDLDFLAFFEAEPEILNPEVGWGCGARYVSTRGIERIEAITSVDDAEFSLKWWQSNELRADLRLVGVIDWQFDMAPGKETLWLKFHRSEMGYFCLQLKPNVCITWRTEW